MRLSPQAPGWARPIKNKGPSKQVDSLQALGYTGINKRKNMNRQIIYKKKKIPLPFKDADYSNAFEMETVSNPFSGQSIAMPKFAVAVYDVTIGSNHLAERYDAKHGTGTAPQWNTVRKGLDWFRRYFAKEYMVLLD